MLISRAAKAGSDLPDHGKFVTVGEFMAFQAVSPDLLGENRLVDILKADLMEKLRDVRERENALDAELFGFSDAFGDEPFSDPLCSFFFGDDERTDLSQVFPQAMEGTNTEQVLVLKSQVQIPDMLIEFVEGTGQHLSLFCVRVNEAVNVLNVIHNSFSDVQQSPPLY